MNPWLDGSTVLANEWRLVAVLLVTVFAAQRLNVFFLRAFFARLAPSERLALGLGGWAIPLLPLSLLWYFTGWDGLFWILPAALILLTLLRLRTDLEPAPSLTSLSLLLFLFLALPLRLAYASQTDLPRYFDSAQHYLVIKTLLLKDPSLLWKWWSVSYYHFGFHFLAAFLTAAAEAGIARIMLILGQVILLLIPFSVFFIVRHESGSDAAGGFALLLAAFGWSMPAHAVNWGKYPALTSVGMIAWLWGMALLVFQRQDETSFSNSQRKAFYVLWAGCAVLTIFTHSRSLIVLGVILPALALSAWLERRSRKWMGAALFAAVTVIAALGWLASRESLLAMAFTPYLAKDLPLTALVFLLAIAAWLSFPRLTLTSVLTVAGLLASLFISVTFIPGYGHVTLLDRPFVAMLLFLPLSLLGGLGLAGLVNMARRRRLWQGAVVLLAAGFVVARMLSVYVWYPDPCCAIVGQDDLAAMDWMAKHLPPAARLAVASTQMNVQPNDAPEADVGADAGVWIPPLTGREAILLPFDTDFSRQNVIKLLCRAKVTHLFVGEMGLSFDRASLDLRPQWYRSLLSMPKTAVYEVTGCE